jgi:PAS domain S-box-containing protein
MPSPAILIVDDDADLCKMLHDILALKGYAPVSATSGQAALAAAAQSHWPAAAVIDLTLADCSGLEVLRRLKALSPAIECLIVTGHPSHASAMEAVNLGAFSYLRKPYDLEQLLTTLRRALERRAAAEALRLSETRYRTLVENVGEGIGFVNTEARFLFANPAAESLFGTPPGGLLGQSLQAFTTPPQFAAMLARTDQGQPGEKVAYDLEICRPDGEKRHLWITAVPQFSETGEFSGTLDVFQDITKRKQVETALREERALLAQRVAERTAELSAANAELARALQAKDEFLANTSHELRSPLGGILNLAELLQMSIYGALTEPQIKAVSTIYDSGQHLLQLINDILDLAKAEADKLELDLGAVVVEDVCEASLRLVHGLALKKHQTLSTAYHPSLGTLYADGRRLKQILVNLLVNAVKFTPEGGCLGLDVEADERQGAVRFTVWDTGIGITPQDQRRLFRPFSQIDSTLSRQYAGTGLGLALARRMVELHGGSIAVDSEGVPGKGSRFVVSLPWTSQGLPPALAPASPAWETGWSQVRWPGETAPLILLADDSPISISILSDFLAARCACRVVAAKNGVEALQLAWEQHPALILMDIQMPQLDGLEAIRRIRAMPELAQLPIIALTALCMAGDRERCLAAGANEFLSKPVSLERLSASLRDLLRPGQPVAYGY